MFKIRQIWLLVLGLTSLATSLSFCPPTGPVKRNKDAKYAELFSSIRKKLLAGDKEGLKDLCDLLAVTDTISDNLGYHHLTNTVAGVAERTLLENLDLTGSGWNDTLDLQKSFYPFYHANEGKIKYSELLKTFLITPLETRTPEYKLVKKGLTEKAELFKKYKEEILEEEDWKLGYAEEALGAMARLRTPEAEAFIRSCLEPGFAASQKISNKELVCSQACWALHLFPSKENIAIVIQQRAKKNISEETAINTLESMTGIPVSRLPNKKGNQLVLLQHYIDSLGTLEETRALGYKWFFPFSKSYFKNPADYYGKILIKAWDDPVLGPAALSDLLATNDPAALKYIAGIFYQHRVKWNEYYFDERADNNPVRIIEEITGSSLYTKDASGILSAQYDDFTSPEQRLNYAVYWNNHFPDYIFDKPTGSFRNQKEQAGEESNIQFLIDQLGSKLDSVASNAYLQLTGFSPQELAPYTRKLREHMLFGYSRSLPMFFEQRLTAHAKLFEYYRQNNIAYLPTRLQTLRFDSLESIFSFCKRYNYENRLISTLNATDINALEYWASIGDEKATYSVGRILDKYYSLHLSDIVKDDGALRLYLKKAFVYDQFGIIGICNTYLWKFDHAPASTLETLRILKGKEKDPEIIAGINKVLEGMINRPACLPERVKPFREANIMDSLKEIDRFPATARGEHYANLFYEEYFTNWLEDGDADKAMCKKIAGELRQYAKGQKKDGFDYNRAISKAEYLEKLHQPYKEQLEEVTTTLNKEASQALYNQVVLNARYKNIPDLVTNLRAQGKKFDSYFGLAHLRGDLGIPIYYEEMETAFDTLLARHKRLTEMEVYRAYLYDMGYRDKPDGSADYEKLYEMLEFDVVVAFVGGGGGFMSTSAFTAIRYLELTMNTRLGFHWRMEYIREGFIRTPNDRACTWMQYLTDKKLVELPPGHVSTFSK